MSLQPDSKLLLSKALYELEKVSHKTIRTDYANNKMYYIPHIVIGIMKKSLYDGYITKKMYILLMCAPYCIQLILAVYNLRNTILHKTAALLPLSIYSQKQNKNVDDQ